jgi:hypothetical protein
MFPEHEAEFVRAFIIPKRRERWSSLSNPKRRSKLLGRLDHHAALDLDPRYQLQLVEDADRLLEAVISQLTPRRGCHFIGGRSDGMTMDLHDALRQASGWQLGTIISVDPGRFAYYEPEDGWNGRFLLVHDPEARALATRLLA